MNKRVFLMPLLTLKSNGGGNVALELARSIAKRGYNITIITSSYHGIEAVNLPENNSINFFVIPSFGGKFISALFFMAMGVVYSILIRPQLIYTHLITSLIPNFHSKRPMWLAQDLEYRFFKGVNKRILKFIFKKIINKTDLLVTSHWLEVCFRRMGGTIIYSNNIGISKRLFDNLNLKIFSQRLNDVLIIAKSGAHKRGNESIILSEYLSTKGYRVILVDQTNTCNTRLNKNLCVIGGVNQMSLLEYLLTTKIFINLSRSEGYGLVPLEALAAGCFVISTKTPSLFKFNNCNLKIINNNDEIIEIAQNAVDVFFNSFSMPNLICIENKKLWLEDWSFHASAAIE